eukprot:g183.t1
MDGDDDTSSTESEIGPEAEAAGQALTPARAAARRDAATVLITRARGAQLRAAVVQWLLATTRIKDEPGAGGGDEPDAGGGADA